MCTIFTLLFNHRSGIKEAHNIAVFTKVRYYRDTYYHHIYIISSSQNQVMRRHILSQYLHHLLFTEFNIRLYDKNSESYYFVFLHQNQIIFFHQHWESDYFFLERNHNPPWKLNGPSLRKNIH